MYKTILKAVINFIYFIIWNIFKVIIIGNIFTYVQNKRNVDEAMYFYEKCNGESSEVVEIFIAGNWKMSLIYKRVVYRK